ncbi:hypothetical protein BSM4216_3096 [Bacillus smithii]|nr:hypothetical protein BSM4216_3096 [Bacillus smithii]
MHKKENINDHENPVLRIHSPGNRTFARILSSGNHLNLQKMAESVESG